MVFYYPSSPEQEKRHALSADEKATNISTYVNLRNVEVKKEVKSSKILTGSLSPVMVDSSILRE
jgi:hypothetical protein